MRRMFFSVLMLLSLAAVVVGMLGLAVAPIVVLANAAGVEFFSCCFVSAFAGAVGMFLADVGL